MANEDMGIDIEKLAQNIAADSGSMNKAAAEKGGLKDLRSIDFSIFLPGSTAETLRGKVVEVMAKADESRQQNKTRVTEVSGQIERSISDRQVKLASGLKELRKTPIKSDAEAKTILDRVSANVDLSSRRLDELQIEKTVRVINIRPRVAPEK